MTDNTIILSRASDCWQARFVGPHAEQVKRLFGSDTIPCPYPQDRSAEHVKADIERLNPGVRVAIADTGSEV